MTESELLGKVIKEINLDGHGIWLMTEDGYCLDYWSSDGGYSSWELYKNEASGVECVEILSEEQEMKCSCFREQYGKTVCYGTKEIDVCSCDGDKSKCDFYPEVREKANPMTNGDRINTMSDKEKAEFLTWIQQDAFLIGDRIRNIDDAKYPTSSEAWLEWLKQPAEV
jgi:hypothetical protein